MRIAFLAPASSIHTARWVNALCAKGCEVTLFSLDIERDVRKSISSGVEVVYLPADFKRLTYVLAARRLRPMLKKGGYDIVNAHYASSYGLMARMAGARPLVVSVWGRDVYQYPYSSPLRGLMLKRNLRYADLISSTSHVMAKQVIRLIGNPPGPLRVVPFGADLRLFGAPQNPDAVRKGFSIGIAKMLEPHYDIQCLIRAFALLDSQPGLPRPPELFICGDGSQAPALKSLAAELNVADRVHFLGHLPHERLVEVLKRLDIFALSSRHESFGAAAVEAMAAGLPVVATDVDGFREVVVDGVTGLIVPAGDPVSMADALAGLLRDEKRRREMGRAGRLRAEQLYDFDRNVDDMLALYREAATEYRAKKKTGGVYFE